MEISFAHDRILAVMAHPDDAELTCAGTLARAKQEGAIIGVCIMCAGDKGKAAGAIIEDLARVRHGESQEAAKLLGADLFWVGWSDAELIDAPSSRQRLVEFYRRFQPTLVLTHSAEDYHPDHRATSAIAEAASWFCASSGYVTDSPRLASPPAVWFADTINMSGFLPGFYVDISAQLDVKKQMLACHKSQLMRGNDGDFSPLMDLMLMQCRTRGMQAGVQYAEVFRAHHAFKRARAW